jgi:soluble lytic murein transglycosylase-like protein
MRGLKIVCLLLSLAMHSKAADSSHPPRETVVLSARWAEYYAAIYRVPVDLVMAIIDEESAWNPYAVSEKGAVGLMQLMPQTAMRFGVRNRFRLDENIRGGVAYLAWLNRRFGGDLRLVTAAYYVGEDPIARRKLDYSSADVQAYVRRVAERYRARRRWTANQPAVTGQGDEK